MSESINDKRKMRGRPATGTDPMTGVRLGPDLRELLDQAAAQENRSRADIIREAIVEWLKAKGYLK